MLLVLVDRLYIHQQVVRWKVTSLSSLILVANKNWHCVSENSESMFALKVELLVYLLGRLWFSDHKVFDEMIKALLKIFFKIKIENFPRFTKSSSSRQFCNFLVVLTRQSQPFFPLIEDRLIIKSASRNRCHFKLSLIVQNVNRSWNTLIFNSISRKIWICIICTGFIFIFWVIYC